MAISERTGPQLHRTFPIPSAGDLDVLIEHDRCRAYVEIFAAGAAVTGAVRRAEQIAS